ncbi:MAG: family phosphatase, partial [Chlamydiia bacterium]|nr:family phosphatase [Chlamydiia bacterium]
KRPKITTLFLDIGGVLLTNVWDHTARLQAAKKFALDPKELEERHRLVFDTFEIGKMSLDEYLEYVIFHKTYKHAFSKKQFKDFMFAQSKANPLMIELFTTLKTTYKLKVVAVSNEGKELMEHRIQKFNLRSLFDFFNCSSFVGLRKPDPEIFTLALRLVQVPPKEILYIDDRDFFVQTAKNLGIHGLQHTHYETTCTQLAKLELVL